jgi:hypothetical protein
MTRVLDRLPLLPETQTINFGQRHVAFHRGAIIVWLSIGLRGEENPLRLSPPFPALLDSGNNCEAYLHEYHLVHWAGIRPVLLAVLGSKRINETVIPCHEADVWIYPNIPGSYKRAPERTPYRLELEDGIAVGPPRPDQAVVLRFSETRSAFSAGLLLSASGSGESGFHSSALHQRRSNSASHPYRKMWARDGRLGKLAFWVRG